MRAALTSFLGPIPVPIRALFAIELGLALMHLLNPPVPLWAERGGATRYMWDLDQEANVPTWFASTQLAVLGIGTLLFAGAWHRQNRRYGVGLAAIGVACLGLSLDELIGAHEKLGRGLEELVGPRDTTAFDVTGPWIAIAAPMFLVAVGLAIFAVRGLFRRRRRPAVLCAAGLGLFFFSFAGLELLANLLAAGDENTVVFEEAGEMAGVTLVLWGLNELVHSHGFRFLGAERTLIASSGRSQDQLKTS